MTSSENTVCDICGASGLREEIQSQEFVYGKGDTAITLMAKVPVSICEGCGFSFTDHRGEEARHEAVCRHLGVLTPNEIESVREKLALSRTDFAELLGVGIASLQRWETGATIQNLSMDNLIRLASHGDNAESLRGRTVDLQAVIADERVVLPAIRRKKRRFTRLGDSTYLETLAEQWSPRSRRGYQCIS